MKTKHHTKRNFYSIILFVSIISFSLNSCYKDLIEPTEDTPMFDFIFPEAYLLDTKAYIQNSDYASTIEKSILVDGDYYTFGELPLIGMVTNSPTVDDIMQRLVVSHNWMGQRFQEIIETYPSDFLKIFRGVTAIVIDDDIRPAYYNPLTATIYLDANYFWLNEEERVSINPKPDYRSNFSNELIFKRFYRYVKDNELAYHYLSMSANFQHRELSDIRMLVARLLLHELAHANDYFPPQFLNSLELNKEPWEVAKEHKSQRISKRLNENNPLTSELIKNIAQVSFQGKLPTDRQKTLTASEIGFSFETDGASDYYNYSTIYEDVAMLFEETMMKYFFDVDRDMAFTDLKNDNDKYIVRWGVRNRFADPRVISRAEFVINQILPEINFDNFIQSIPETQSLPNGIDWRESLQYMSRSSNPIYYNSNEYEIENYIHYH